jgi:hypothetical protein
MAFLLIPSVFFVNVMLLAAVIWTAASHSRGRQPWPSVPAFMRRWVRLALEIGFGLINPVLYLAIFKPALSTLRSGGDWWLTPLTTSAWILLTLFWTARVFGAALDPRSRALRAGVRALLVAGLACLLIYTIKDAWLLIVTEWNKTSPFTFALKGAFVRGEVPERTFESWRFNRVYAVGNHNSPIENSDVIPTKLEQVEGVLLLFPGRLACQRASEHRPVNHADGFGAPRGLLRDPRPEQQADHHQGSGDRIGRSGEASPNPLQFRCEMYNAFYHTQYFGLDTTARFDTAGNQVNPLWSGDLDAALAHYAAHAALSFLKN